MSTGKSQNVPVSFFSSIKIAVITLVLFTSQLVVSNEELAVKGFRKLEVCTEVRRYIYNEPIEKCFVLNKSELQRNQ